MVVGARRSILIFDGLKMKCEVMLEEREIERRDLDGAWEVEGKKFLNVLLFR